MPYDMSKLQLQPNTKGIWEQRRHILSTTVDGNSFDA
jgi:hypothetical protein